MDRRDLLKRLALAGLAIPAGLVVDRTLVPQLESKPLDVMLRANVPHYHHEPMVHPILVAQTGPGTIYGVRLLTAPSDGRSHGLGNFYGLQNDGTIDYMTYVNPATSTKGWLIEVFPK